MRWGSSYGGWAPYVPVHQRLAQGAKAARDLAKAEKREPSPVIVTTREIAKTFWGKSWCDNLERYSDFANRLPRGRTYLRNGSVADLVVESGKIRAIVCGSEAYRIVITIKPLKKEIWSSIERDCAREINSLFDLLQGKFSNAIMQRLTREGDGLFPANKEISMSCSCPDGSYVCKHIAATIYGVGARLDTQPDLLFKLRQVNHLELIGKATESSNLERALTADPTMLEGEDLGSIFGIELESDSSPPKRSAKKAGKAVGKAVGKSVGKVSGKSEGKKAGKSVETAAGHADAKAASQAVGKAAGKANEKTAPKTAAPKKSPAEPEATLAATAPLSGTPKTSAKSTRSSAPRAPATRDAVKRATKTVAATTNSDRLNASEAMKTAVKTRRPNAASTRSPRAAKLAEASKSNEATGVSVTSVSPGATTALKKTMILTTLQQAAAQATPAKTAKSKRGKAES
ncbi:MAG: hypothetical protein ACKO38_13925 [Planctomycetota bacterium]